MSGSGVYELYGRRVRSNVGLGPIANEDGPVDLHLRLELGNGEPIDTEMPPGVPLVGSPGRPYVIAITRAEDGYHMRARELIDLRFNLALDSVVCYPGPGVGPEHLRDLSTTLLSTWMVLCGCAVFHGSAVLGVPGLADDKALALVGPSFAGKSTWAALLCNMGARFVTDDALPIGSHDGKPALEGGCPEIRLRHFAPGVWPAFDDLPRRPTVDGRVAVLAGSLTGGPIPLLCVVVLEPAEEARQPQLQRLHPRDAMVKLSANQRLADVRLRRAQIAHFERASEVAQSVPVFAAHVPTSGPPQPAWADELISDISSLLSTP